MRKLLRRGKAAPMLVIGRMKIQALLIASLVFVVAVVVGWVAYVLLGVVTGVISICSCAPEWWIKSYLPLSVSVPVGAAWLAVVVGKRLWPDAGFPEIASPSEDDSKILLS